MNIRKSLTHSHQGFATTGAISNCDLILHTESQRSDQNLSADTKFADIIDILAIKNNNLLIILS